MRCMVECTSINILIATTLLAHDPFSSSVCPMITYTHPTTGNLPIKTLVANQRPTNTVEAKLPHSANVSSNEKAHLWMNFDKLHSYVDKLATDGHLPLHMASWSTNLLFSLFLSHGRFATVCFFHWGRKGSNQTSWPFEIRRRRRSVGLCPSANRVVFRYLLYQVTG